MSVPTVDDPTDDFRALVAVLLSTRGLEQLRTNLLECIPTPLQPLPGLTAPSLKKLDYFSYERTRPDWVLRHILGSHVATLEEVQLDSWSSDHADAALLAAAPNLRKLCVEGASNDLPWLPECRHLTWLRVGVERDHHAGVLAALQANGDRLLHLELTTTRFRAAEEDVLLAMVAAVAASGCAALEELSVELAAEWRRPRELAALLPRLPRLRCLRCSPTARLPPLISPDLAPNLRWLHVRLPSHVCRFAWAGGQEVRVLLARNPRLHFTSDQAFESLLWYHSQAFESRLGYHSQACESMCGYHSHAQDEDCGWDHSGGCFSGTGPVTRWRRVFGIHWCK